MSWGRRASISTRAASENAKKLTKWSTKRIIYNSTFVEIDFTQHYMYQDASAFCIYLLKEVQIENCNNCCHKRNTILQTLWEFPRFIYNIHLLLIDFNTAVKKKKISDHLLKYWSFVGQEDYSWLWGEKDF